MIVADTNLISYFYIEGEYSTRAEAVYNHDSVWAVPLLWRSEFRNVLAFYLRKKIINYDAALECIEQAEKLLGNNEYSVSSEGILDLIKNSSCSAYDCEFVFLAQELGVPLVTADKKILSEFPKNTIAITKF